LRERSQSDRTAPCAVRQVRDQIVEGKRGVNDPGIVLRLSPQPYPVGSFTPRVSLLDEALVWCSIVPENLPDRAEDRTLILRQLRCAIRTAITFGIVRARHGAVQGSSLRSDRARCARLALVTVVRQALGCRSARDLDGVAPERRNLAIT
jgi:hypothetical protein